MRPVQVTANISNGSNYDTLPVVLNQYTSPNAVTYVNSGSGTVQVSSTDPFPVTSKGFTSPTFVWVTAPTTAPNAAGFLGQPFRAIRLTGAALNDTLTVVQAGIS
jgi:hypothetical protein